MSVISLAAASSSRVFIESLDAQRRAAQFSAAQAAAQDLLFRAANGEMSAIFVRGGGMESGQIPSAAGLDLNYEIESKPYRNSKRDFDVEVKIFLAGQKEIYHASMVLRNET